jgi:hypothetical protein
MENQVDNNLNGTKELERGGCLTVFLIAMFILNPITGFYYLIDMDNVRVAFPNAPEILLYLLVIFSFINLGLAIATWNWKKIGVIGFWITAVMILIINFIAFTLSWLSFLGLLGPIILSLLVRPKWSDFK